MKKALISIFIFFVAALALRHSGLDITYVQLISLLGLLWIFRRVLPRGLQISNSLAISALVFASLGVAVSFNLESFRSGGVLVARFSDDPLESKSRLFRHQVSEVLKKLPGSERVHRYPTEIKTEAKAHKLLIQEKRIGLIWGQTRAVSLSVRAPHNDSLLNIVGPIIKEIGLPNLSNFYLARYVTGVSLPLDDNSPADLFIGYLLTAINSERPAVRSSFIAQTLSLWGPWRWLDHRAYPFWLEGTDRLVDAIDSGQIEPAELGCADRSLRKAMSYLNVPGVHKKLLAAIFNNYALVVYLKKVFFNEKKVDSSYSKALTRAAELAPHKGNGNLKHNLHLVALHNLSVLKGPEKNLRVREKKSVKRRSN